MIRKLLTLMFCLSLITAGFSSSTVEASSWTAKIDPWLMEQEETLESGDSIEFLVFLTETADLSGLDPSWTKQEKGTYVFERLTETAQNTQKPVLEALESLGAETRAYWVANMIWARGSWQAVEAMASRQDVRKIYGNPQVKVDLPEPGTTPNLDVNPDAIEWNILKVNADDVWALGITGEGVVIGGQDTGYDWDHPGLVNQYREQFPGYGRHDFNWHDAIHEGGSSCGADSPVPCDDYGHGTHTMGTMVGDDGGANQVGMAPGAQWIGCRNMNNGNGTPATYTECFEFFLAPYPVGGDPMDGDPTLAPDVISNSWGCPPSEGCALDELLAIVSAVRDAGIMVVASAGNEGPDCGTVVNPIGIYDQTFSVGATDSNDNIAGFSSRGPASWDGNVFLKPDISAPGSNVRSTIPGTGYGSMSGTSMAAPHVAGLVALLISANPDLAGQVDLLEQIIEGSAVPRTTTQDCGGVSGDDVPNNTYGWGRIDALAAVESIPAAPVAGFTAPATAHTGEPVQFIDTTSGMGPFTYFWMFGDGLGTSTEQNPVYTYMMPGIFTITQTVTNTFGTDSFGGTIEILPLVALESVSVTLETTGTIYPDSSVDFSALFGPDDLTMPITYTLDFGDGTPVVTSTLDAIVLDFSHMYADSGTFMVTLQAWNYLMDPSEAVNDSVEVLVTPEVDFRLFLPLILK